MSAVSSKRLNPGAFLGRPDGRDLGAKRGCLLPPAASFGLSECHFRLSGRSHANADAAITSVRELS